MNCDCGHKSSNFVWHDDKKICDACAKVKRDSKGRLVSHEYGGKRVEYISLVQAVAEALTRWAK